MNSTNEVETNSVPESNKIPAMIEKEQVLAREREFAEMMKDDPVCQLAFWTSWANTVRDNLPNFRGEMMYLSQIGGGVGEQHYVNSCDYAWDNDELGLMYSFKDDNSYGNIGFTIDDEFITRDLLDSCIEINFLAKHLGWTRESKPSVLDIGAGYGRFAKRLTQALPNSFVLCTDAVPLSLAICDLNAAAENSNIGIDIPKRIDEWGKFDLAINIHSWSESPAASVRLWVSKLVEMRVKHLFICTHPGQGNKTWDGADMVQIIESLGYRLRVATNKFAPYEDPQFQRFAYDSPYLLFELEVAP